MTASGSMSQSAAYRSLLLVDPDQAHRTDQQPARGRPRRVLVNLLDPVMQVILDGSVVFAEVEQRYLLRSRRVLVEPIGRPV